MPDYVLSDAWAKGFEYDLTLNPCPKYLLLIWPEERGQINGTTDSDYISGTDGHDLVYGRNGNDYFLGSPGYDEFHGGAGIDTVDYYDSCCPVYVDLLGNGYGGHAHGDTYSGVENVTGSTFGDTLIGDNRMNRLDGGRGADLIEGRGGDDELRGGSGYFNDTLIGGAGDDVLYGGPGENVLTGGAHADTFEFLFIDTVTTITDFTVGEDTLHIVGFYDYAYFEANAVQVGADVHFSRYNSYLDYTAELIIENVSLATLSEGDFLFD